jgi:hypothetical protein
MLRLGVVAANSSARLSAFSLVWLLVAITAPSQNPAPPAAASPAAASTTVISPFFGERAKRRDRWNKPAVIEAIRKAATWLIEHQDEDGRWSSANFAKHDFASERCDGAGMEGYDVGVTALALLALLAEPENAHKDATHKAADWLAEQVDAHTGSVPDNQQDFIYEQAFATLALIEATVLLGDERYRAAAKRALRCLERRRNPESAWRYTPSAKDNDSSISCWCIAAYVFATHADIEVPSTDVAQSLSWFDSITEFTSGHCGYMKRGELSSRRDTAHAARFPAQRAALTAAGLHARLLAGMLPSDPLAAAAAKSIALHPPTWEPNRIDLYAWCQCSIALAMLPGSAEGKAWEEALHQALLPAQSKTKSAAGSWDPIDCWGECGGRVATTAFAVLALASPFRMAHADAVAAAGELAAVNGLRMQLQAGRLADAMRELARLTTAEAPPAVAASARRVRWLLDLEFALADEHVRRAKDLLPEIMTRRAMVAAIAKRCAGLAVGQLAAKELEQLAADPHIRREDAAEKELQPLAKAFEAWRARPTDKRREQLRTSLSKFVGKHDGTLAAARAITMLTQL